MSTFTYLLIFLICSTADGNSTTSTTATSTTTESQNSDGSSTFGTTFAIALPGSNKVTYRMMHAKSHLVRRYSITSGQHSVVKIKEQIGLEPDFFGRHTHVLGAKLPFQVSCVAFVDGGNMVASFLALPLEAWGGEYMVFTSSIRPSVQIINGHIGQDVEIFFSVSSRNKITGPKNVTIQRYIKWLLNPYGSLSVQLCSDKDRISTFSGTRVSSSSGPISVITGNCFDSRDTLDVVCGLDMSLDSPLPITAYATSFVVATPSRIVSIIQAIFREANTTMVIDAKPQFPSRPEEDTRLIGYSYDWIEPFNITSDKPIVLAILVKSGCSGYKEAAISMVVPTGLFMDTYFWVFPDTEGYSHFLLLVHKIHQQHYIYLDDRSVLNISGGAKNYYFSSERNLFNALVVGSVPCTAGRHQLYSINSFRFGAYLYGWKNRVLPEKVYMTPLGYVSRPGEVSSSECGISTSEGDLRDNDCDGLIDEERRDGKDNDRDGRIDEDKGNTRLVNGGWSVWLEWQKEGTQSTKERRTRYCDNPAPFNGGYNCQGHSEQWQNITHAPIKPNTANSTTSSSTKGTTTPTTTTTSTTPTRTTRTSTTPTRTATTTSTTSRAKTNTARHTTSRRTTSTTSSPSSSTTTRRVGSSTKLVPYSKDKPAPRHENFTIAFGLLDTTTPLIPITEPPKIRGVWGHWSEWGCMQNCTVSFSVRTRVCLDPPEGPKDFDCPGFGYQFADDVACKTMCLTTCPHGQWGMNCSKSCHNCDMSCDKDTGSCSVCKPGFKYPQHSCSEECDAYKYGYNCLGDCTKECDGNDCVDRVTGKCPFSLLSSNLRFGFAAIPLILLLTVCIISGRMARKNRQHEKYETLTTVEDASVEANSDFKTIHSEGSDSIN